MLYSTSDVPNAPQMGSIKCNNKDATIEWEAMGDNRAAILRYTIQYNTTFTGDSWEVAYDSVPAADRSYTVNFLNMHLDHFVEFPRLSFAGTNEPMG